MTNNLQSASVSDRGLSEKRPHNEDSFLEIPASGLFVVADGVGGAQAGEVASQMATEILGEAFTNLPAGGDAEEMMKAAIEQANASIYQMSRDLPQLSSMATTVVALHVNGNIATIGHVGDSRLYRVDARGNLFRETQDHSVVEEEVRAGRMTQQQAATHPSRNVISRALGAESSVEIDMKTIMFEPETTFLLCSDGITRHIEDHEIRDLINSGDQPSQICENMKYICYSRGAEDNLTAVIVKAAVVSHQVVSYETTKLAHPAAITESNHDIEEPTAAAARAPLVNTNVLLGHSAKRADEVPAQTPETTDDYDQNQQTDDASFLIDDEDDTTERPIQSPVVTTQPEVIETPKAEAAATSYYETNEPSNAGSSLGKILSALALILVGAIIGAGAYHFLKPAPVGAPTVQNVPQTPEPKTSNIPYSAFEDNRRNVDRNPAQFVSSMGASAADAEDFYLLGRANLLNAKYVEAKNAFAKAKELLPQSNAADKSMLANEIAIGLSIVDSGFAKKVLETEKRVAPEAANQTNTSVNKPDTEIKPLNANANN